MSGGAFRGPGADQATARLVAPEGLVAIVACDRSPGGYESRTELRVLLGETLDGAPLGVPAVVLRGQRSGPLVWVQAGLHGDELNAVHALHEVLRVLDGRLVRGRVVAFPTVNLMAFRALARVSPLDGIDANRVWGDHAQALAGHSAGTLDHFARFGGMLLDCSPDLVVDMHDGGPHFEIAPHAAYVGGAGPVRDAARGHALAAGLPFVVELPEKGVTLDHWLRPRGLASLTVESGGTLARGLTAVASLGGAVLAIMRRLSMVDPAIGGAATVVPEPIELRRGDAVRAPRSGLLVTLVGPGSPVARGQVIGDIFDAFGRHVADVRSPAEGRVVGLRTTAVVNAGDQVASVALAG